ncbi:VCBS repeat-containing protein [Microbacterium sp. SD291]|uniref:FG-GAP repeat domain-containing protein n=1 Tax=Microbacterium sp. SD291 TaxID=2782007 RepID=UPI001A9614C9|nr:VCBS repeat-containing protein [Microbacterium sp. SD291]MBO0979376.1 VCBS repeat-containing protein [Microbacterium sp. SD291]
MPPRSRNAQRLARLLLTYAAVAALVVGVFAPIPGASASASVAGGARIAADPAASGIVKTTLAGFSAGNIISDAVFTNKSTMTEAQIQTFFNSKVPKCLGGSDKYGPIVCLKDFKTTSVNRPADAYCSGYTGAADESAARIIHRVAQACNINPQVLIVMLQKEQGLVTHTWPSAPRYSAALGQGCPDGGVPCDPNYVGFFHQIYGAARQMQIYMEGRWFTYYAPGKTWNIRYNPEISCGSAPVYVANKATAALFYYTPYQPNAAALRAGYGEGDACSAYGNRNFYNYFTDWFGSTQAVASAAPSLTSVNTSSFVAGVDAAGKIWGYPFNKGTWGARTQIGATEVGLKALHGLGDLDGDGNRDFVAVGPTNRISILNGTGTTNLSAGAEVSPAGGDVVLTAAAGDFSGDGVPDLFSTNAAGQLLLWRGDDRGGFRAPLIIGTGWSGMNMLIGGTDFNGDGATDLVARDRAGYLRLYLGTGLGKWKGTQQIGIGWSQFAKVFTPGDFNGDGRADLLAETSTGVLSLYPGAGDGYLRSGTKVGVGWNILAGTGAAGAAAAKPRAFLPGVGDLDRSQGRDVVAVTGAGALMAYGGNGSGGWAAARTVGQGWASGDVLLSLGDFSGDGNADLGRVNGAGDLLMLPGNGAGGYVQPVVIGRQWGDFAWLVGGIDFDGDRRVDVLARASDGRLLLYRGDGEGGWSETGIQIGKGWGSFVSATNGGDFDGDGRADLVARHGDGTLWLYASSGDGAWLSSHVIGWGWSGMRDIFSPGDFDGDGRIDVLARDQSGVIWLYRGDGKGSWRAVSAIGRGWASMLSIG